MSIEPATLNLDTEVSQATPELERGGFASNRKVRLQVVDHEEAKERVIPMIYDLPDKIEEEGMVVIVADL